MVRLPAAGTAGVQEAAIGQRRPSARRGGEAGEVAEGERGRRSRPGEREEVDDEVEPGGAEGVEGEAEESREGLREPPPGTPPAIARVFRRLPLSVHDGPPVGGIGGSGIHVDKIWLGSRHGKQGCAGKADGFSIRGHDEVNVCFRVVHGRTGEDVDVIWEKDGDLAQRRRGVTIPPLHAYRTRAYLVLRNEYVGAWRVRVLSEDGVELASAAFNVVE